MKDGNRREEMKGPGRSRVVSYLERLVETGGEGHGLVETRPLLLVREAVSWWRTHVDRIPVGMHGLQEKEGRKDPLHTYLER
jgi:hypothetical protein